MRYRDLKLRKSAYKVWYTHAGRDWTLDQIISAMDEDHAIHIIKTNYPWAVVVDWALVDHNKNLEQATHMAHAKSEDEDE
tara:strand:- start:214 stop:453 length:240 start_codon:yes stop_codon:yes gene_type:complete